MSEQELIDAKYNEQISQRWRAYPDDRLCDGMETAESLMRFGVIDKASVLLESRIGDVYKTGVSAYERVS